jgi:hypothetical protein
MNKQNFTLSFGLEKFFDFVVYLHRKKMYQVISPALNSNLMESILDIGSTSDTGKSSNAFLYFFNAKYIASISDQVITEPTKQKFPNVNFIKGDGLSLTFADSSFDFVFSNAVLEHVGGIDKVTQFISESIRVTNNKVIIITPNRWFPLETHTKLLFLHWLPPKYFRYMLNKLGMKFFAKEENLNLLSKSQINRIVENLSPSSFKISYIKFMGYPSNIVLEIDK